MADSCLPESSSRGPLHRNSRDVLYGLDQSEDSPDLELVTFDFPAHWRLARTSVSACRGLRRPALGMLCAIPAVDWGLACTNDSACEVLIVWPAVSAWTAAKGRVEPPMPAGFTIQVQGQVLTEGKEPKPVFNVLVLHRLSGVSGRTDPTGSFSLNINNLTPAREELLFLLLPGYWPDCVCFVPNPSGNNLNPSPLRIAMGEGVAKVPVLGFVVDMIPGICAGGMTTLGPNDFGTSPRAWCCCWPPGYRWRKSRRWCTLHDARMASARKGPYQF